MNKIFITIILDILFFTAVSQTVERFYTSNGIIKDVCQYNDNFYYVNFPDDSTFEVNILNKNFQLTNKRSFLYNGIKPYFKKIIVNRYGIYLFGQLSRGTTIENFNGLFGQAYKSFFVLKLTRFLLPVDFFIYNNSSDFYVFNVQDNFLISFDNGEFLELNTNLDKLSLNQKNYVLTDIDSFQKSIFACGYYIRNKNKAIALFLLDKDFSEIKSKEFYAQNSIPINISVLSENKIILTGYLGKIKLKKITLTPTYPAQNVFIMTFTNDFNFVESKVISSPADINLYDFYISDNGKLIFTGTYKNLLHYKEKNDIIPNQEDTKIIKGKKNYDIFIVEMTSNLTFERIITFSGLQDDITRFVYSDSDYVYFAAAYRNFLTLSDSNTIGEYYFPYNYAFVKVSFCPSGVHLFGVDSLQVSSFPYYLSPTNSQDYSHYNWNSVYTESKGIWITESGTYFLTVCDAEGCIYTDSIKITNNEKTLISESENNSDFSISIYPNPMSGNELYLRINSIKEENLTIEVYDAAGRSLAKKQLKIQPGIYIEKLVLPVDYHGIFILKIISTEQTIIQKGIKK